VLFVGCISVATTRDVTRSLCLGVSFVRGKLVGMGHGDSPFCLPRGLFRSTGAAPLICQSAVYMWQVQDSVD